MCFFRPLQILLFVLIITLPPSPLSAERLSPELKQTPTIIWGRTDFAPFFIQRGEHANQGISDNVVQFFIDNIKDYQHESVEMSLKRLLQNAKAGIPTCHVVLLRTTEREKYIDYSTPYMLSYANGIITSAAGLQRMGLSVDNIEAIDLEKLTEKALTISVHDGRSYSPQIDRIIAENRDHPHSIFRVKTGLKELDRLITLVANNRLDGLLARPEEAQFIKQEYGVQTPLYFVEIKNSPNMSMTHVGCTKGDWNNDLFGQIAELVKTRQALKVIESSYSQWLPDHLKAHYAKVIAETPLLTVP